MSNNQTRIHPLPLQLENNNNNNNRAPPPGRCVQINCNRPSINQTVFFFSFCWIICGLCVVLFFTVGHIVVAILQPTINPTVFFHVVNASLTQFDLTTTNNNSNTLDYKLTIDINATNPNKDYIINIDYGGINYGDDIEVRAYYQGNLFDSVNLMPFHQDTNKSRSTSLHAVFQGQDSVPKLQSDRFYRDKSDGNFDIQLQFYLSFTYHYKKLLGGIFSSDKANYKLFKIKCDLKMRDLLFNASSSSSSTLMNGSSSNVNPPPSTGTSTTMVGAGSSSNGGGRFQTKECEALLIIN